MKKLIAWSVAVLMCTGCAGKLNTDEQRRSAALNIAVEVDAANGLLGVITGIPPSIKLPVGACLLAVGDSARAYGSGTAPISTLAAAWSDCDQKAATIKGLNPEIALVFKRVGKFLAKLQ